MFPRYAGYENDIPPLWEDAGSRYALGKTWKIDADTRKEVGNSMAGRENLWVSRFLQLATSFHQLS